MQARFLEREYGVNAPSNWAGKYLSDGGNNDGSWSWYKDGDRNKTNFPHFTVAFDAKYENDPVTDEWLGFHISVPRIGNRNNARNMRFNFKISGGVVRFGSTTTANMPDDLANASRTYRNDFKAVLDEFARAFHKAALARHERRLREQDDQRFIGVSRLFGT